MYKTSVLTSNENYLLQKSINNKLEELQKTATIIDIKFSTSISDYKTQYSALILYTINQ